MQQEKSSTAGTCPARGAKPTPVLRQYLEIKEQYPDAILFFRMGDFYEMFYEDAHTASRALEITLTSRNKNDPEPVPMCGVPVHAADGYVAKLLEQGLKVAVCDQVQDAASAKGLVKREVVRVVTPGMVLDPGFLDPKAPNWVLALCKKRFTWGAAMLDLSTGEFLAFEEKSAALFVDEVLSRQPREVLLPEGILEDIVAAEALKPLLPFSRTTLPAQSFDTARAGKRLAAQFCTHSLEGFGVQDMGPALGAAGAVLDYVESTQKREVSHVTRITPYSLDRHLIVGEAGARNLELFKNLADGGRSGTLFSVLDFTRTAMGGRLLRQWLSHPLLDVEEINRRLDAVEEAKARRADRAALFEALEGVYDLERLRGRLAMGQAGPRDLAALRTSLEKLPGIYKLLSTFHSDLFSGGPVEDDLSDAASFIAQSIVDDPPFTLKEGGIIRKGFSQELDDLVETAA
ncbi:MAG: DNA mismatch repair protein MutS, partial [Deltaproteobacteria bacterium]|nr:DNA mismatch repair protein MutS [Deltaproteobacteria bacterium]